MCRRLGCRQKRVASSGGSAAARSNLAALIDTLHRYRFPSGWQCGGWGDDYWYPYVVSNAVVPCQSADQRLVYAYASRFFIAVYLLPLELD